MIMTVEIASHIYHSIDLSYHIAIISHLDHSALSYHMFHTKKYYVYLIFKEIHSMDVRNYISLQHRMTCLQYTVMRLQRIMTSTIMMISIMLVCMSPYLYDFDYISNFA